jgi:succinoglycan biosynthesis transport protein ExoP
MYLDPAYAHSKLLFSVVKHLNLSHQARSKGRSALNASAFFQPSYPDRRSTKPIRCCDGCHKVRRAVVAKAVAPPESSIVVINAGGPMHAGNFVPPAKAAGSRPSAIDFRLVVDEPFSPFAETIRSLQIAAELAELGGRKKILGVTSARPREGKSLVGSNLTGMLAISGSEVLLFDCQPRNPELTQQLMPKAKAGPMRAMANPPAVDELIWRDKSTNLDFLPMDAPASVRRPIGVVSASVMRGILAAVQDRYDYIVVDLPALTPVADVKAVSNLIDHFLLVIEWARTSQSAVLSALDATPLVYENLLGIVLNNADQAALKKLEA